MKLFNILALALACSSVIPSFATENKSKEIYDSPKTMEMNISIKEQTEKSVTFHFDVKSLIGNATEVKLSAKVLGNHELIPVPQELSLGQLESGKSGTLDFTLPLTKEQTNDKSLKIQGTVEYLPDYDALIKTINEDAEKQYPNELLKQRLIDILKDNQDQQFKSVEIIRYMPEEK